MLYFRSFDGLRAARASPPCFVGINVPDKLVQRQQYLLQRFSVLRWHAFLFCDTDFARVIFPTATNLNFLRCRQSLVRQNICRRLKDVRRI